MHPHSTILWPLLKDMNKSIVCASLDHLPMSAASLAAPSDCIAGASQQSSVGVSTPELSSSRKQCLLEVQKMRTWSWRKTLAVCTLFFGEKLTLIRQAIATLPNGASQECGAMICTCSAVRQTMMCLLVPRKCILIIRFWSSTCICMHVLRPRLLNNRCRVLISLTYRKRS